MVWVCVFKPEINAFGCWPDRGRQHAIEGHFVGVISHVNDLEDIVCRQPPIFVVKLYRLFYSINRQDDSVARCSLPPDTADIGMPRPRSLRAPIAAHKTRETVSPTEADLGLRFGYQRF